MNETDGVKNGARERLGGRSLVFDLNQGQACRFEPDVFKRFVELGVKVGATHVHVGDIPFRYGHWVLPDNVDPYAAWCNHAPSIFRVCPPKEIQEWAPMSEAERCRSVLRAQLDTMKPHGLKGTCFMPEPMWLPEGVYRAHPRWRGAQCELGRIALRPYFAPNIDEPEVLALYRRAIREYVELFPEIDEFDFLANDSGSGVNWTSNIYPGLNGPVSTRLRDGGERIANWLKALKEGAAEGGADVRFSIHSAGFSPELKASTLAKLEPGLFMQGANSRGEGKRVAGANMPSGLWSAFYPALNLGSRAAFVAELQRVYDVPKGEPGRASIGMGATDMRLGEVFIENVIARPGQGVLRRTEILLASAAQVCGSEDPADRLVHVWESVDRAVHAIGQIRQKGFGMALPFCAVSMRWLTRPLVPRPEELTSEETAHYREFLFSPGAAKDNPHFGYVLGKGVFRGESVMWMARWCLQEAIGTLRGAASALDALIAGVSDTQKAGALRVYGARVRALACLATNARNTIMYQYALDTAGQPMFGPNAMDYDDNMIRDHRSLGMRKIAREELDNTAELIALIEANDDKIIEHADTPEEESVFMLGPDPVADLNRKMDIMWDHWQDYETLYPTCKVWDFDPELRDNSSPLEPRMGSDSEG